MRATVILLIACVMLSFGAATVPSQVPPVPTPLPNRISSEDEQFIKQLSQEVGISYIAAQAARNRATKPAVRDLGVQVSPGLHQVQQDVTTLAIRKDVILSNPLEAPNQRLVDALSSASLDEFDSKYVETLLQFLPSLLARCEAIVATTGDADLKAYALKLIPVLQSRIDAINAVRKDL